MAADELPEWLKEEINGFSQLLEKEEGKYMIYQISEIEEEEFIWQYIVKQSPPNSRILIVSSEPHHLELPEGNRKIDFVDFTPPRHRPIVFNDYDFIFLIETPSGHAVWVSDIKGALLRGEFMGPVLYLQKMNDLGVEVLGNLWYSL